MKLVDKINFQSSGNLDCFCLHAFLQVGTEQYVLTFQYTPLYQILLTVEHKTNSPVCCFYILNLHHTVLQNFPQQLQIISKMKRYTKLINTSFMVVACYLFLYEEIFPV